MLTRRKLIQATATGAAAVASSPKPAQARESHEMPPNAVGLLFDGTLCIGCRACMSACKEANDMPPEPNAVWANPEDRFWDAPLDISGKTLNIIKAYRHGSAENKDEAENGFAFTKLSCFHCVDPSCVSACPVSAMTKDKHNGIVNYSVEACIGCRYCVAACPFGVPRFTFEESYPRISKCQLCKHRLSEGKYAACAEVCPTGATLYGPVSMLKQEIARRKSLTPGDKTTFPRGQVGSDDRYPGTARRYIDHVYGEKEIGGTQVLHMSGVPFHLLDKPDLPDTPPARIAETLQHTIYHALVAPIVFLLGLTGLAFRNMRAPEEGQTDEQAEGDNA